MGLPDRRALVIVYAIALILTIEQWLDRIAAQLVSKSAQSTLPPSE